MLQRRPCLISILCKPFLVVRRILWELTFLNAWKLLINISHRMEHILCLYGWMNRYEDECRCDEDTWCEAYFVPTDKPFTLYDAYFEKAD